MTDWRNACQWGLIPLAGFWLLGTAVTVSTVENDLSARSLAALGGKILDKPAVSVLGRDAAISGGAFAADGSTAAYDAVLGTRGVRLVDSAAVGQLPEAKPYVWSATKDGAKIALGDGVPNPDVRAAINDAAKKIPGADVADGMAYKRGDTAALGAGAAFALAELGHLSKGAASLSDGKLTISGTAPDSASFEAAIAELAKPPAGVTIAKADLVPPLVAPYVLSAESAGGSLRLTGSAPSIAARDAIAAAAKAAFPSAKIENAIGIASGAPKGDEAAAITYALGVIAGLDNGKATLTDSALTISGQAKKLGDIEALAAKLATTPPGFTLAKEDVAPPVVSPYVFSAERAAGGIVLTGLVPDEATRGKLIAAAKSLNAGDAVDKTQIAAGVPAGFDFATAASFAIAELAKVKTGLAALAGSALSFKGDVADQAAADAIAADLKAAPGGVALGDVAITAPPSPPPPAPAPAAAMSTDELADKLAAEPAGEPLDIASCTAAFKDILSVAHIEFDSDKASISPTSADVLTQVAAMAKRCQTGKMQIAGYTDSTGDPDANKVLSEQRAQAVVAFLQRAGVPADRMTAVGFGADNPIAPNDTEAGKAQNRRIEINVSE